MKHAVYLVGMSVLVGLFTMNTLLGIDWLMVGHGLHPLVAFVIDGIIGYLMVMATNAHCGEYDYE